MNSIIQFWQTNLPILSILLPACTAFILVLLGNPGAGSLENDWRQPWRRGISYVSAGLGLLLAISYVFHVDQGAISVYLLSEWSAPFGIILVLDRLSAFMLLLTYALAVPVLWYASSMWDRKGRYFHTMMHFLLMGICGAFLTGDLFNLFVFFEILLLASYVLLLHGQGKARFQLGIHYVVINLLASALFLIGLGMIYGSVGSLNMVDVARLFPLLPADEHQLALAGGLLLFVVFGIKAAILPVGFWLPKTYAVASTPVAAIFTIMTKVGIYAILRVNGTVFDDIDSQKILQNTLLVLGLIGTLYGAIAAMAAERLRRFVGFMVLSSIGTLLIALSMMSVAAWSSALYYLAHSTLVAAALYLLTGWITSQRGEFKDHLKVAPKMKQQQPLALCYFILALMLAGLPPFSGFLGKVFILQATATSSYQLWIIGFILVTSLISILGLTRVGFILFWRATEPEDDIQSKAYLAYQAIPQQAPPRNDLVIYLFISLLIGYMLFAHPILQYTHATATQLKNPLLYQQHILKYDEQGQPISVQPYDAKNLPQTTSHRDQADPNVHLIPHLIAEKTLQGEHISPQQQQQIAEYAKQQQQGPQLQPQENP